MTDWVVYDVTNDEPLAVFPDEAQAKNQVGALRDWMDDYYRENSEDVHEYQAIEVNRMERHASAPVRVWSMKTTSAYAWDELWWPWNVGGFPLAERIVAGEVVEWVPGMFRGLDKQAVEAAAFRAKEARV